jgi:hypothetical protein
MREHAKHITSFKEGIINDEIAGEATELEAREADCPSGNCRDLRPFCMSTPSLR